MADRFNMYAEWLGLSASDGRPSYYELLSLRPFEVDPQAIAAAAGAQLAKVRGMRPGARAVDWSRLLDELEAARRWVLDVAVKARYDETLRQSLGIPISGQRQVSLSETGPCILSSLAPAAGDVLPFGNSNPYSNSEAGRNLLPPTIGVRDTASVGSEPGSAASPPDLAVPSPLDAASAPPTPAPIVPTSPPQTGGWTPLSIPLPPALPVPAIASPPILATAPIRPLASWILLGPVPAFGPIPAIGSAPTWPSMLMHGSAAPIPEPTVPFDVSSAASPDEGGVLTIDQPQLRPTVAAPVRRSSSSGLSLLVIGCAAALILVVVTWAVSHSASGDKDRSLASSRGGDSDKESSQIRSAKSPQNSDSAKSPKPLPPSVEPKPPDNPPKPVVRPVKKPTKPVVLRLPTDPNPPVKPAAPAVDPAQVARLRRSLATVRLRLGQRELEQAGELLGASAWPSWRAVPMSRR